MSRPHLKGDINPFSRLRTRMAISYVLVTLVIVLMLDSLVITVLFYAFTRSPFSGFLALERAGQAARIYALQAAVQADGAALDPNTTFEPGRSDSLSLREEDDTPHLSFLNLEVPYVETGAPAPNRPVFALLIDPGEQVLASSYPDQYPVSLDAAQALPEEIELIRGALAGRSDGAVKDTPDGMQASVARTIWST